ncbi:UNVERIFIED_CONTAM: Transcription factor [Sesamum angustifolium]|uniref:Transcription factor n=1 Tax=Sesamum angustifolium TaxID=2727405 RepID=A0AAW2NKT0_9LAMI
MGIDPVTHKPKNDTLVSSDGQSKNAANLSHMAQWESARLEAEARLVRQSKLRPGSSTSYQVVVCDSVSLLRFENKASVFIQSLASKVNNLQKILRCIDSELRIRLQFKLRPEVSRAVSMSRRAEGLERRRVGKANEAAGVSAVGIGGDLESPTSTLSSAAGVGESSTAFVELVRNSSGTCDAGGTMKDESEGEWKNLSEYRDGIGISTPFPSELQESTFPSAWEPESMRGNSTEHVPCGNFVEKFTDLLLSTSSGDRRFSDDGGESDNGSGSGGGSDYYEDNKNYWNSILNLVNSSPSDSPIF